MKKDETNLHCITDKIIEELKIRRAEYGLSYAEQAREIGVSWLTLRNWIHGKSKLLTSGCGRKLELYLQRTRADVLRQQQLKEDAMFQPVIEKAQKLIHIIEIYPEAKEQFVNEVNNVIRETIEEYNK